MADAEVMAPSPASPIPSLAFEAAMADEGEEGDDGKGEYVAPPRWMRPRSAPAKPRETPESPATTRPGSAVMRTCELCVLVTSPP